MSIRNLNIINNFINQINFIGIFANANPNYKNDWIFLDNLKLEFKNFWQDPDLCSFTVPGLLIFYSKFGKTTNY